jgi:hypothetical protein
MRDYNNQNQANKSTHCLSHISPNTLTFLRNHHKNIMKTKKIQAFDPTAQKEERGGDYLQQI